jgi:hypothetical protein
VFNDTLSQSVIIDTTYHLSPQEENLVLARDSEMGLLGKAGRSVMRYDM